MSENLKMRTIPEAAKELKENDPRTHLSLSVLRRLVKNGSIPYIKSGRRILINISMLSNYLYANNETQNQSKIRRVSE